MVAVAMLLEWEGMDEDARRSAVNLGNAVTRLRRPVFYFSADPVPETKALPRFYHRNSQLLERTVNALADEEMVDLLLTNGADSSLQNAEGMTALGLAQGMGAQAAAARLGQAES